jgi:ribose/xylose/arabinose/galactoside ABC-type transport system permease subunit/ABC-type sugar transport system substrate-binding protein
MEPAHWMLLAIIVLELIVFSALGTNFLSRADAFELVRQNVEIGVIALAMTPVIISGGIDLSVGSTMALAAITFGALDKSFGLPWPAAAAAALAVGLAAGWLNGELIARLAIPPLIVTLGTLSLLRGIAEGVTAGAVNYTGFSRGFLSIGQGTVGPAPAQTALLVAAVAFFYVLQHRSTIGRSISAIGYSPEGARYAGIPVQRRLREVYVLSGLCAAAAAIVYVARVGQAKADAGSGYELTAITAVVLGGTSIFGGRGSIVGTLLGLLSLALLDNGIRLADGPAELGGILKGILLLLAIGADRLPARKADATNAASAVEEFEMKNGQLAVLCGTILLAALLVVFGNFALLHSLRDQAAIRFSGNPSAANDALQAPGRQITIAMMPKSKGNAYFIACHTGAEEAARALNVNLIWDGPDDSDPAKQNEIVDTWVTRGVDAIAVSVENRDGLSTALRAARAKGTKVVTWDADALPDARDLFVNQATPEGIGDTLMDDAAATMGGKGEFAIITASLTAANQNEWMKWIEKRRSEKYPEIKMVTVRPCDDQQPKAFDQATTILQAYPDVKLIMAISSAAVPGAAEAVKQSGRTDVHVVGLGLPNDNKPYVHSGITTAVVLWNTMDLGYLTIEATDALVKGALKPGDASFDAGRVGLVKLQGDNVMLGMPYTFTKDNIDQFDF